MDKKKKRKIDTVPEIYMRGSDTEGFFMPNYPVEDSACTTDAFPGEDGIVDNYIDDIYRGGDWRIEHNL